MEIPAYNGRPLSIINKLGDPPNTPQALWFWSNSKNLYPETPEMADQLTADGYQYIAETDQAGPAVAATQFADAATFLVDPDKGSVKLYMHTDDVERIRKYPVSLAFALDLPAKEASIPMLQFLPLPHIGEYAIIHGKQEAISIYHIEDLPERAGQVWQEMGRKLRELAAPGGWYLHSEMHSICTREDRYQQVRAGIEAEQATQTDTRAQRATRMALQHLEEAHTQVLDVRQSWLKPDWLERWKDVSRMAQELSASYYEHHRDLNRKARITSIPPVTSTQNTMIPSSNGFRGLVQSFGPGVQAGLWNTETSAEMMLNTPNNTLLKVKGENAVERVALHQYITDGIGVEGLKHMVGILHAYHNSTGAHERKEDAIVSLYGLLKMMGYDKKAEEKEEQHKLMNTLLYLSRTWVQSHEITYEQEGRGRGGKQRRGVEYSPLIVLEALKASEMGGITIPEKVEFHLGKEFYDLMFGDRQQYYSLPTAQILSYHSKNEQQEICLAFYLTNYITMNAGHNNYSVYFSTLLEGSAIRLEESIEKSINRTRDALRAIYAIEHLQKDGWFTRPAHEDIDTALAVDFYLKDSKPEKLAEETRKRIISKYAHLAGKSMQELKRMRRIALQNLLDGKGKAIEFKPGTMLQAQAEKIEAGRQRAKARNERAITARVMKAAKKPVSPDLADKASSD